MKKKNRWFKRCQVAISFYLLAAITMASTEQLAAQDQPKTYFIMQLTDPQLGFFNNDIDFIKDAEQLERAIAAANRLKPDFVVVTGDLINKTGDTDQVAEYKHITGKLDPSIPLYNVPGNHDVGNEITAENLKMYRKYFGKDYYAVKIGGTTAIFLNTPLVMEGVDMAKESAVQYRWLEKKLKRAKRSGHRIIVFQHHPWFLHDPDEKDQYFNIPVVYREKYLALLDDYNVTHVFAGHLHYNATGKLGDMEMITSGPIGRPLKDDPSGIRIIKISGDSLTHRYYPLDVIPERL